MEIEDANELIYYTYYMINWNSVKQYPSETKCVTCNNKMLTVERIRDKKGLEYEGHVCHNCKNVFWIKRS
jgi:uncharacterized protein with PIN domain